MPFLLISLHKTVNGLQLLQKVHLLGCCMGPNGMSRVLLFWFCYKSSWTLQSCRFKMLSSYCNLHILIFQKIKCAMVHAIACLNVVIWDLTCHVSICLHTELQKAQFKHVYSHSSTLRWSPQSLSNTNRDHQW